MARRPCGAGEGLVEVVIYPVVDGDCPPVKAASGVQRRWAVRHDLLPIALATASRDRLADAPREVREPRAGSPRIVLSRAFRVIVGNGVQLAPEQRASFGSSILGSWGDDVTGIFNPVRAFIGSSHDFAPLGIGAAGSAMGANQAMGGGSEVWHLMKG